MNPSELLGTLLPGHPDFFPIIQNIREKYQIPEIRPEDEEFTEILLTNHEIDWRAVRQDIEQQIRANDSFLPPATKMLYKGIQTANTNSSDFPELAPLDEKTRNTVISMYKFIMGIFTPLIPSIDDVYKACTDMVFEHILTGKTRAAPQDWFGKVVSLPNLDGEMMVIAVAGALSDPKVIAQQFKAEYKRTFGRDRLNLTEANLKTAEYLAMRLQGKPLKYMVEIYAERHPDEFPTNRDSTAYRKAVTKHRETIKKNLQRLQDALDVMLGDKN